jgi:hypothetical protein
MLVRDESDDVYIAGEIELIENKLTFNFMSGTYGDPQKLSTNPIVSSIFSLTDSSGLILDVNYVDNTLFPIVDPSNQEIDQFCNKFSNQIFMDPDVPRCDNDPSIKHAMTHPLGNVCTRRTNDTHSGSPQLLDLESTNKPVHPSSLQFGDIEEKDNDDEDDDDDDDGDEENEDDDDGENFGIKSKLDFGDDE